MQGCKKNYNNSSNDLNLRINQYDALRISSIPIPFVSSHFIVLAYSLESIVRSRLRFIVGFFPVYRLVSVVANIKQSLFIVGKVSLSTIVTRITLSPSI